MSDPWLSGLIACALHLEAEQVRAALHARGLRTRSVPAGRAKEAWTCATDRGTMAVVVSGKGAEAVRQAGSFWMPRARWLVLAQAGPGTGMAEPGSVVLDGDPELAVLAAKGAPDGTATLTARVATVEEPVRSEAARQTLQTAGYAAWSPQVETWQRAARAAGGVMLVCHGVTAVRDAYPALVDTVPEGSTGHPWWQAALDLLMPASRSQHKEARAEHTRAAANAARCAVAALLGPQAPRP